MICSIKNFGNAQQNRCILTNQFMLQRFAKFGNSRKNTITGNTKYNTKTLNDFFEKTIKNIKAGQYETLAEVKRFVEVPREFLEGFQVWKRLTGK